MLFNRVKKDDRDYDGSSEVLKKNYDVLKIINHRFLVVSIVITLLMGVLSVQLYTLVILNGNHYAGLLSTYSNSYLTTDSQRGDIYDSNGVLMATSTPRNVITYAKINDLTNKEMWEISYKFIRHFNVSTANQSSNDVKYLYVHLHQDEIESIVDPTVLAQYKAGDIDDSEYTNALIESVTDEMVATLTTEQKKAFVVKTILENANDTSFNIVLDNASSTEIAYFVEHIDDYPGFTYLQDWDRKYTTEYLNGIVGSITSSTQGLLAESSTYYQALGYAMNSRIGKQGIELQYESLLSGTKTQYEAAVSTSGNVVYNEISEGSKGYTLITTFDLSLQAQLEALVINYMKSQEKISGREKMDKVYLVLQEPSTGEVLAAVAMKRNTDGTYENDPSAIFSDAMAVGSTVKGATIYTAFDQGVIDKNTMISDQVWQIQGSAPKKSWRILGTINYLDALALSSNVFMWEIATRLGGGQYIKDMPLDLTNSNDAFTTLRNYFSQFGLGVKTQVDFPNETTGLQATVDDAQFLLDIVIGQYDNYTPIQLSQYISTIANNGQRVKPRLVTKALDPITNAVVWENTNQVISTLTNSEAIKNVQDGFRLCVTRTGLNLCAGYEAGLPSNVDVYAKTGTAEVVVDGVYYWNHMGISYSKSNNSSSSVADLSIVCAVPYSTSATAALGTPCATLTSQAYRLYYNQP